jgi:hypothetical protein
VTFAVPQVPAGLPVAPEPLPAGVTQQTLAGDLAAEVGLGPLTVSLARVTLGRHAQLAVSSAAGPILLAVDTGRLAGPVWGTAWARRASDGSSAGTHLPSLAMGDGLLLQPGGVAALHNDGATPVEALVLALQPAARVTPAPS